MTHLTDCCDDSQPTKTVTTCCGTSIMVFGRLASRLAPTQHAPHQLRARGMRPLLLHRRGVPPRHVLLQCVVAPKHLRVVRVWVGVRGACKVPLARARGLLQELRFQGVFLERPLVGPLVQLLLVQQPLEGGCRRRAVQVAGRGTAARGGFRNRRGRRVGGGCGAGAGAFEREGEQQDGAQGEQCAGAGRGKGGEEQDGCPQGAGSDLGTRCGTDAGMVDGMDTWCLGRVALATEVVSHQMYLVQQASKHAQPQSQVNSSVHHLRHPVRPTATLRQRVREKKENEKKEKGCERKRKCVRE